MYQILTAYKRNNRKYYCNYADYERNCTGPSFPFKRPHETMKLAIPSPTNTNPPIVISNPNALIG